jgi:hypothetical protein
LSIYLFFIYRIDPSLLIGLGSLEPMRPSLTFHITLRFLDAAKGLPIVQQVGIVVRIHERLQG